MCSCSPPLEPVSPSQKPAVNPPADAGVARTWPNFSTVMVSAGISSKSWPSHRRRASMRSNPNSVSVGSEPASALNPGSSVKSGWPASPKSREYTRTPGVTGSCGLSKS
jgi:hypothetical protein